MVRYSSAMRILLTGAAGFIGSHTCERLCARGHEVHGIDGFDTYLYPEAPKRRNAAHLQESLPRDRFTLSEMDICDRAAVHGVLAVFRPDVVCHLAALAGVRPSLRAPERYLRTNLEGTIHLLEGCRAASVDRMVFASSSSVYGARGAGAADLTAVQAFREDDPCLQPASPYAASKRAGELFCSTYRDLYGIGISALRFFTVYGPRQRPDMAIHAFARRIAAGEPITMYGDGTSRRDYTYIDDIVAGTVAACERITAGSYNIYNLGGTRTVSLAHLIEQIAQAVGKAALIEKAPMQPGDVPITYADIRNSKRDLDYAPTIALPEGLRRFWSWLKAQPDMPDGDLGDSDATERPIP